MVLTESLRHNLENSNFLAFDSFEGLPQLINETSSKIWKKGALTTSETEFMDIISKHGIYVDKIKIIKGYYNQSLNKELQLSLLKNQNKAMLVNIDCDLYESAVPCFNFIEDLIQEGAVIYIDDLFTGNRGSPHSGVAKAFIEYQKNLLGTFYHI